MAEVLGIICAYQHESQLKETLLAALYQDIDIDWTIWNNGGISSKFHDEFGDRVTIYDSPENLLWSPAINHAVEMFRKPEHRYLLFMNHDVIMPYYTVSKMYDFLEHNLNAGAVAPVGHGLGGLQDYVSHKDTYTNNYAVRSTYIIGAIQMIPFTAWDAVGPLDESMPLGGDDFDYSIRLKEQGYSLWIMPSVVVNHRSHITGDSENWSKYGKLSWQAYDDKYEGYFASKEEADGTLWGSIYNEQYPLGTGFTEEEKIIRGIKNA